MVVFNNGGVYQGTEANPTSGGDVARGIIEERPDAILVNEGANTLDFTRSIIDMYKPRKRLDVGTWGVMGIGMGSAIAAAVERLVHIED